jgi:KUP system potassium uptake protein
MGETLTTLGGPNGNPFYLIMADWFQPIGIIIQLAAVIASQALISGSFTLIIKSHAIKFLAKSKIEYPTEVKDNYTSLYQLVIIFGCVGIVLHFEESGNMEHAYGLA